MAQKKKLQVFVSSTYTDLHEERQAAVQAILTAGHIPAGMELFAAGDETQMNVIKRWIDESDVYMLILGGRYGSIESKSQKSYIHLEYEYAVEKGKPLFAVVIDESYLEEKVKKDGLRAIEKDHSEKLKEFRELVCSKMVRFWKDPKDIKLAVMETMADFSNREELIGWIPGNEAVNASVIADELARLAKENADLREKINNVKFSSTTYNGLTFDEYYKLLRKANFLFSLDKDSKFRKDLVDAANSVANIFKDEETGLIHAVWLMRTYLQTPRKTYESSTDIGKWLNTILGVCRRLGLVEYQDNFYSLTDSGKQFLLRLNLNSVEEEKYSAHDYIFSLN